MAITVQVQQLAIEYAGVPAPPGQETGGPAVSYDHTCGDLPADGTPFEKWKPG